MRPPRYQFPEEVRSATRRMASVMVRDGSIARTPEELEGWIAQSQEVREPLIRGGYGTEFTAEDLYPLLEAMVTKAGGPPPAAAVPPAGRGRPWMVIAAVAVAAAVLLFVLVGFASASVRA
jgi:hypothetical protein